MNKKTHSFFTDQVSDFAFSLEVNNSQHKLNKKQGAS